MKNLGPDLFPFSHGVQLILDISSELKSMGIASFMHFLLNLISETMKYQGL